MDDITSPFPYDDDVQVDETLRPSSWQGFIGQTEVGEHMRIFIEAAKKRGEPLDHCLLYGPPGLGKTTLAHIIANELGVEFKSTTGPVLEKKDDLAAILTDLKRGDVLFIDEIHRINRVVEECLYPAMEDYKIDILIGEGPHAKSIKIELPEFTLVGATTRAGMLTSPLRTRFGITERLRFYNDDEMEQICKRSARILNIEITETGAYEIARRSRGTPRICNRILKRVRDYAEVKGDGLIDTDIADAALDMLGIDSRGLDAMSQHLLRAIIEMYHGGPVGLNNISVALGESVETIEDVYEPFLIQKGLLKRTPKGRMVTPGAYEHLGIVRKKGRGQDELF